MSYSIQFSLSTIQFLLSNTLILDCNFNSTLFSCHSSIAVLHLSTFRLVNVLLRWALMLRDVVCQEL